LPRIDDVFLPIPGDFASNPRGGACLSQVPLCQTQYAVSGSISELLQLAFEITFGIEGG